MTRGANGHGSPSHVGVALDDAESRSPRRRHVRAEVGHGQDVRRRRGLAHRPRRRTRRSRRRRRASPSMARDRHHLGAGLAVHVHEHGEEELDAVALDRLLQLRRARDRGRLARLQCARHAVVSPPVCRSVSSLVCQRCCLMGNSRWLPRLLRNVACSLTETGSGRTCTRCRASRTLLPVVRQCFLTGNTAGHNGCVTQRIRRRSPRRATRSERRERSRLRAHHAAPLRAPGRLRPRDRSTPSWTRASSAMSGCSTDRRLPRRDPPRLRPRRRHRLPARLGGQPPLPRRPRARRSRSA